jgi:hypothetical protein
MNLELTLEGQSPTSSTYFLPLHYGQLASQEVGQEAWSRD